ncbi:Sey1p like P-loop GTPase of the RHD3 like [Cryptosporidium canis]|uniref:Sey1p like P-loop GTPase of the RHD3 like n=1 Tax=Cryptosporidium canis TaxID=195482 RepID=A0A9D5DG38_9CRYT|nr:Sey1p like P-loop GTPase of the RHD3 like [Cryptosporidium canis]
MRQIIDYDCNFKEDVGGVLRDISCGQNTLEYNVISILGCQSTGKSTLLNSLFGTQFKVLDKLKSGYCQTTKGLWLGCGVEHFKTPALIWDVEGTDSLERGEDRVTFENRAALFSLAVSDCMILNIPLMSLTTYSSSNFGLLKTILNSWFSLKLDQNGITKGNIRKTTLLFAVRDITINDNDEMLTRKISQILDLLWKQVSESQNSVGNQIPGSFSDIFDIKVYGIPSLPNDYHGFKQVVERIRSDLSTFILPHDYSRCIPLEGFEMYCSTVWKCIVECQELNIPSQIKLISRFRCEQTKDDILDEYNKSIKDIQKKMQKRELSFNEFSDDTLLILNNSLTNYFEVASKYDNDISTNISLSLLVFIFNEFQGAVNLRMSLERHDLRQYKNILDYYKKGVEDHEENFFTNDNNGKDHYESFDSSSWVNKELLKFDTLSSNWKTEFPSLITKRNLISPIKEKCIPEILNDISQNSQFKGATFATYNTLEQRRLLSETLEIHSKKIYEKLVEEFFESLIKDILKEISPIFSDNLLSDPKLKVEDFWRQVDSSILSIHKLLVSKYEQKWVALLRNSYIDDISPLDLEEEIALQLVLKLILLIQQQSKYFHIIVVERFKSEFELDQDGVPRQWIGEDAKTMKDLFIKAKANSLMITGVFYPRKDQLIPFSDQLQTLLEKVIESSEDLSGIIALNNSQGTTEPLSSVPLVSENSLREIESKASQEIASIFSKAQLIQSTGGQSQNIPWWIYLLIIVLGFDEITYVLTSPLLVTILLVLASFIYSLFTGNFSSYCNYSKQFLKVSSKMLHYISGALHNSLDNKK